MAGTCRKCGVRVGPGRRLCRTHELSERNGDSAATDGGYTGQETELVVKCTKCKTEYRYQGEGACPNCGARVRRYVRDAAGDDQLLREAQT